MIGTVEIHDMRTDVDHRLDITEVRLRNGHVHIEASGVAKCAGSIQTDDVITVYDPDGKIVTRYWIQVFFTYEFNERESVSLILPISLGGPRGMAMCDTTLDVTL